MADPGEVTHIIKASVQLRAKFEEEHELCIPPHAIVLHPDNRGRDDRKPLRTIALTAILAKDGVDTVEANTNTVVVNIKTMVISQLQPLQIIVTHTGVQHLAGKQLSQATCEDCRESMGISGCVMGQKWMCLGCTILCRGCLAGFCDDHCSQLTHRCPDLFETDTRLARNEAATDTSRATEVCGALCPECCGVEERPGCCIEPPGHEDEHYCGKCGYCEEGSNGNIWTALGHAGAVAMFDTSSHHADIAECPPVTALSHAGPAPPVPNQTVALTSNAHYLINGP